MRRRFVAALVLAALALGGCSSSTDSARGQEGSLTVLAAASLQQAFDDIAAGFTAEHPGMSVDFNYAGSSTLVQNLDAGAPADVVASADEANMDTAQDAGLIVEPTRDVFAANTLVGIVPLDKPANIDTLAIANSEGVSHVV